MNKRYVVITGANRGLGLGLVREFFNSGWCVFACCRSPENASELAHLARTFPQRLTLFPLDVTNPDAVDALAASLTSVDVLINNAAIYGQEQTFGHVDFDSFMQTLDTNVLGCMRVMQAVVPVMAGSSMKLVINVSSLMGSMADNRSGGAYIYRASKAALNAVTRSAAMDLADRGFCCVAMHPGWAKTDMGGERAPLEVSQSAACLFAMIKSLTPRDNGRFLAFDGRELPW